MKKVLSVMLVVLFVAGLVVLSDDAAFAAKKKDKGVDAEAAETSTAPEPKVLYKFKNSDQMTEFEQLYISKQATFGRMGVLQAYFSMEQNNLTAIDKQMDDKFGFKMEPDKMYDLNRELMEICELGPVSQGSPLQNQ